MRNRTSPITRRQALAGLAVPAIAAGTSAAAALSAEPATLVDLLRAEVRQIRKHVDGAKMAILADRLEALLDGARSLPPLVHPVSADELRERLPDDVVQVIERSDPNWVASSAQTAVAFVGPEGGAA